MQDHRHSVNPCSLCVRRFSCCTKNQRRKPQKSTATFPPVSLYSLATRKCVLLVTVKNSFFFLQRKIRTEKEILLKKERIFSFPIFPFFHSFFVVLLIVRYFYLQVVKCVLHESEKKRKCVRRLMKLVQVNVKCVVQRNNSKVRSFVFLEHCWIIPRTGEYLFISMIFPWVKLFMGLGALSQPYRNNFRLSSFFFLWKVHS